jgi:wyosine [tRNA(Phe)-imidazoG37] synthetase (radical SAM superfamily)
MSGILFDEIIFGPLRSRRFGISLGINLLPLNTKMCSFNCIYCECGLTLNNKGHKPELYTTGKVLIALEERLKEMAGRNLLPDAITFAGNGEPTMHPDFLAIMEGVVVLRNRYVPEAKVTILSNATMLGRESVQKALKMADNNVLKLDAGSDELFQLINRPLNKITIQEVVGQLAAFVGNITIQTLFLRGDIEGRVVDNTTDPEISAWIGHLKRIQPKKVMIYPIDRLAPFATLEKIPKEELDQIAVRTKAAGILTEVYT